MKHWQALDTVLLTNYGDGTGYDIRLSGSHCRPRVWVADMGRQETQDTPPVATAPMWSDQLGALEPGKSMSVVVMSSPDKTLPRPVVEVSWPRLPRRGLGRKRRPTTWRMPPPSKPAGRASEPTRASDVAGH
jgi:hypothetical protein